MWGLSSCTVAQVKAVLVAVFLLAINMQAARAQMWVYVDPNGGHHYTNTPPDKRYAPIPESMPQPGSGSIVGSSDAATIRSIAAMEISPGYLAVRHLVRATAQENQIDVALLQAIISTESGFDARAVSPKGALGLMQVTPATALRYGITDDQLGSIASKLIDPKTNLDAGTRLLRDLVNRFPGQLELALAAYNAGEGAVQRAGNRIPNFPETQNYVRKVMQLYGRLRSQWGGFSRGTSTARTGLQPSPDARAAGADGISPHSVN